MAKKRIMLSAVLKEISAVTVPAQEGALAVLQKNKETPMDPEQVKLLTSRAERAEKALTLPALQQAIFTSLADDAAKDAFLALAPEDREKEVTKAAEADPIVHTDDLGVAFRKSDGEKAVALAKQAQELRTQLATSQEVVRKADLRKRALTLGHLPGSVEEHEQLIEAVEKSSAKEGLLALLGKLDGQFAKAFESIGTSATPSTPVADSPMAKLDALVARTKTENPKLSANQAYVKALQSEEGQALYAEQASARKVTS